MIVVHHENRKVVQLYWDDLSAEAKERLLELFGENGNYDVTFVKGTMTITPASTDSNQGGSSDTTTDDASGNTGSAGNTNTGDTGSGNPPTSDRNVLSFVTLLLAGVAFFVGVIWLTMRRKEA